MWGPVSCSLALACRCCTYVQLRSESWAYLTVFQRMRERGVGGGVAAADRKLATCCDQHTDFRQGTLFGSDAPPSGIHPPLGYVPWVRILARGAPGGYIHGLAYHQPHH